MTERKQCTFIHKEFSVGPDRSATFLMYSAPKGYAVAALRREGTKAVVTYASEEWREAPRRPVDL